MPLAREIVTFQHPNTVDDHRQRPGRRHPRVFLPQRTGSRIARISKGVLTCLDEGSVEVGEISDREKHLAPNFKQTRDIIAGQLLGYSRDRTHVRGDVLTDTAITACRPGYKLPVSVDEVDRQPVNLQLAEEIRDLSDGSSDPAYPF